MLPAWPSVPWRIGRRPEERKSLTLIDLLKVLFSTLQHVCKETKKYVKDSCSSFGICTSKHVLLENSF